MDNVNSYSTFLNTNHLSAASQIGSFNPAMLLRFNYGRTDLERQIIGLHERTHAHLSATVYGRTVFLLRFFILDALAFWSLEDSGTPFHVYWDGIVKIDDAISELISAWILSHEGVATYRDKTDLEKRVVQKKSLPLNYSDATGIWNRPDPESVRIESKMLLAALARVFDNPQSPYKMGYDIVNSLFQTGAAYKHIFGIIHEIANTDFFGVDDFDLMHVTDRLSVSSPDALLQELLTITQNRKNKELIRSLPDDNYIKPIREFLSQQGYPVYAQNTSQNMLDAFLNAASRTLPLPNKYLTRVTKFRQRQLHFDRIQKAYISTRLMFNAHKGARGETKVENDPPPIENQPELISELQAMCDIDWSISQFLPHDPDGFREKVITNQLWFSENHKFALLFNAFQ